jgi:hypothetical protein
MIHCVLVLSYLSQSKLSCLWFAYPCLGQVWWLGATAHGVSLASIRPGRVWFPGWSAHGAMLGSTKADQVYLDLIFETLVVSWLAGLGLRLKLFFIMELFSPRLFRAASFTWWLLHWTGVVSEDNCTLCASGKYQTGSGPYLLLSTFVTQILRICI